ncbi:MAG: glycogen debranching enzyme family protein [Planctomycetes bacterium]|nr:glycogen debranching enzyme family protein [Planctomycetota bacterium]MBI3843716.1 glycogen debranching enzyme family protein [Planctomycetota bacterium]
MEAFVNPQSEWLEADALGGFASGTVSGIRTRRYHALLLTAVTPPTGRFVLVNGFDAWVETPAGRFALSSQRYAPDVVHPDGASRIVSFEPEPWPRWVFRFADMTEIEQEIFAVNGHSVVALAWRVRGRCKPGGATLTVRPFLSGRDYHSTHHENSSFRFQPEVRDGGRLVWHPYDGIPKVLSLSNGEYAHEPQWYRSFLYEEERARGLDDVEDLAAPGTLRFDLSRGEAVWMMGAEGHIGDTMPAGVPGEKCLAILRAAELKRRDGFATPIDRAADAYVVRRGQGRTLVAGYPWFTDWGRDTFIAMRGLCLATSRLDLAREILLEWAGAVSEGMLPNRFPDRGEQPEFNSVDASLWFVIAADEYLDACKASAEPVPPGDRRAIQDAIQAILEGYSRGTRFGIRGDVDGLLAAGEPGWQLTWMDAKVGDWCVTPRVGKPVEVQALWLNALAIGGRGDARWRSTFERGRASFVARFWNEAGGYLHDVVDVDHHAGAVDSKFRPNQLFAIGGLPLAIVEGERARRIVDACEQRLWTPLGPRTLAPGEPDYVKSCEGNARARDGAYHQGTVWPWLAGAFVDAWVRVRGGTAAAKREARDKFLASLQDGLDVAGLGHLPEIADADPPHTPRGCPFQAWSLGEFLRLDRVILASSPASHSSRNGQRRRSVGSGK